MNPPNPAHARPTRRAAPVFSTPPAPPPLLALGLETEAEREAFLRAWNTEHDEFQPTRDHLVDSTKTIIAEMSADLSAVSARYRLPNAETALPVGFVLTDFRSRWETILNLWGLHLLSQMEETLQRRLRDLERIERIEQLEQAATEA